MQFEYYIGDHMDYQLPQSANMWVDWKEGWAYPTACVDFELVECIVAEEIFFDLLIYANLYKALPSLSRWSAHNAPSLLSLSECSDDKLKSTWQFLMSLNELQNKYPFVALRLVTALLCIHPHVPKLSTDDLAILFSRCLQDERLDKVERIEFIARCRKKAANAFNDAKFRLPLTSLFIEASRENPAWGLMIFGACKEICV